MYRSFLGAWLLVLAAAFCSSMVSAQSGAGSFDEETTRWVRNRRWSIDPPNIYNQEGVIERLVLWLDNGGQGKNWTIAKVVPASEVGKPIEYDFGERDEGVWGYLIQSVERDIHGNERKGVTDPSQTHMAPRQRIVLDWTPPQGRILQPAPSVDHLESADRMAIEWTSLELNASTKATSLWASIDGKRSWKQIAGDLSGIGYYDWDMKEMGDLGTALDLWIKVEITDRAGNIWRGVTEAIRVGQEAKPTATVRELGEFVVEFAAKPRARLGHRDFDVFYTVVNRTGQRVRFVELYYTLDPAREQWWLYGRDPDIADLEDASTKGQTHSMRVVIPQRHLEAARAAHPNREIDLGLTIVAVLEDGRSSRAKPKSVGATDSENPNARERGATWPMMTLELDIQAPYVSLRYPRGLERFLPGQLVYIEWWAADRNLGEAPVTLELRAGPLGPDGSMPEQAAWHALAVNLPGEGVYVHTLDNAELSGLKVRVRCTDEMGNSAVDESDWFTVGDRVMGIVEDPARQYENARQFARRHYQAGTYHMNRGNLDRAESEFRSALSLWAQFAEASNNLGVTLYRKGRFSEASRAFQQAAEIDNDNPRYQYNLGMAYVALGQRQEALTRFATARKHDPNDQKIARKMVEVAMEDGNEDFALRVLDEILPPNRSPANAVEAWAQRMREGLR